MTKTQKRRGEREDGGDMKIKISEVWNSEGRSQELAVIEIGTTRPGEARQAVYNWIDSHRPDLYLADSLRDHGFHAVAVPQ